MYKILFPIIIVVSIFLSVAAQAQTKKISLKQNMISHLVFDSPIKSIKTAIPDTLLMQNEDNSVYITPLAEFQHSNISIVTIEGDYYAFNIDYSNSADTFNYFFTKKDAIFTSQSSDKDNLKGKNKGNDFSIAFTNISAKNGYLTSNNATRYKDITMIVKGVYVNENNTFLKIYIENNSSIDYNIDALSFYVRARDQSKTITNDQMQILPIDKLQSNNIALHDSQELIFVFEKFTINNEKVFCIDLTEDKGERNLSLKLNSNIISKAKNLNK